MINKILYSLRENPLSRRKETRYSATVRKTQNWNQNNLITLMERRNTTFSRQELEAVVKLMNRVIVDEVTSGNSITTDIFKAGVSIQGGFRSDQEKFNKEKHSIVVNMNPTKYFRRTVARNAKVKRIGAIGHHPFIKAIFDYKSRKHVISNDVMEIPSGTLIRIRGNEFLYKTNKAEIYFLSEENDNARIDGIVYNASNTEILCALPEKMPLGTYTLILECRTDEALKHSLTYEGIKVVDKNSLTEEQVNSAADFS